MQRSSLPGLYSLVGQADICRREAYSSLDSRTQSEFGQFLTPPSVAALMAGMFELRTDHVRLLDPGAGTGILTAALVEELCNRENAPAAIEAIAYEVDDLMAEYLQETFCLCQEYCEGHGVEFGGEVRREDFIKDLSISAQGGFLATEHPFDAVIVNPPYGKLRADSAHRRLVEQAGVRVPNEYAAFVAVAALLLDRKGELVAITPRSFCNGPYFSQFRKFLVRELSFRRIHVFEARDAAFKEGDVLQENVIVSAVRSAGTPSKVTITCSPGPMDEAVKRRSVAYEQVVKPDDPDCFIHLITDSMGDHVTRRLGQLDATLRELGLSVSTGPVVDFRHRERLRQQPGGDTVPLIYPCHVRSGFVDWPGADTGKPNAFLAGRQPDNLLVPEGCYVVVKRFTSKEEKRRLVAAVYEPHETTAGPVAFENHLNYYHRDGAGLETDVARGLAAYLNSTLVDKYFRLFSGHTQVNATDLRRLPYPRLNQLKELGRRASAACHGQQLIDDLIREVIPEMAGDGAESDPVEAARKKGEAQNILKQLGLPRAQQNERSALTLLALLNVRPDTDWQDAEAPLRGITEMMNWFEDHYGTRYAPNTRETVRRQTIHQFVQAGVAEKNPDDPSRPTHSPATVYRVTPQLLETVKYYGTSLWDSQLADFLEHSERLQQRYERDRELRRVPVHVQGEELVLSPGEHSELIRSVIEDFCSRFTPGAEVLYIDERGEADGFVNEELCDRIGLRIEPHGRMPDVVVYDAERQWLVLVEAVTTHGPVNPTRREQLSGLFGDVDAELIYVTAFPTRQVMTSYLSSISWETEVWVADAPSHLIHFDGERFLGPHGTGP
ncbi:MAG: BsuBI/PstI family type II restriction endonuclease [Candidatus Brocadiia bacterium]